MLRRPDGVLIPEAVSGCVAGFADQSVFTEFRQNLVVRSRTSTQNLHQSLGSAHAEPNLRTFWQFEYLMKSDVIVMAAPKVMVKR
jgi:hypothetical protein